MRRARRREIGNPGGGIRRPGFPISTSHRPAATCVTHDKNSSAVSCGRAMISGIPALHPRSRGKRLQTRGWTTLNCRDPTVVARQQMMTPPERQVVRRRAEVVGADRMIEGILQRISANANPAIASSDLVLGAFGPA